MASRGIPAGKAFIELSLDDRQAQRALRSFRQKFSQIGNQLRNLGGIAAGFGTALTAPLVGAIRVAGDFQESLQKFNVVFGDLADGQRQWIEDFADQVGRGRSELVAFAAEFQDLLVPIGFESEGAADTSRELLRLSVDLASFNNLRTADVVRDLSAALTGSSEVMKKYGVIVNQAALEQELLNQGLDPRNVTEQEKAQARLNIIIRSTTSAQGDAVRSAGSFNNQLARLRGQVSDLAVSVGEALLPPLTDLTERLNQLVPPVIDFVRENERMILILGTAAASLSAIGVTLLSIAAAFKTVATLAAGVGAALSAVGLTVSGIAPAILAIGAAVAAVTGGVALLRREVEQTSEAIDSLGANVTGLETQAEFNKQLEEAEEISRRISTTSPFARLQPEDLPPDPSVSAIGRAIGNLISENRNIFNGQEFARNLGDAARVASLRLNEAFQLSEALPEIQLASGTARQATENIGRAFEDVSRRESDQRNQIIQVLEENRDELKLIGRQLLSSGRNLLFGAG